MNAVGIGVRTAVPPIDGLAGSRGEAAVYHIETYGA